MISQGNLRDAKNLLDFGVMQGGVFAFLRGLRPDDFALRAEILDPDVRRCINRSVHERACQVLGGFI